MLLVNVGYCHKSYLSICFGILLMFGLASCVRQMPSEVTMFRAKPFKADLPAAPIPMKKEMIVIDAGHGGHDTGSMSKTHNYVEKQLALDTALSVCQYLEEMGYKTKMTRYNDRFIPLSERAKMANDLEADLFVSVHYNHCPSQEPHGIEIFTYKEHGARFIASTKLGEQVNSHIVKYTGMHSRGVKQGNLAVVRETKMPAILVEAGFLSNPREREKVKDPQHQRAIAWGIAKGIDHYLKSVSAAPTKKDHFQWHR